MSVAVIGAGAAGLITTHELVSAGLDVTVFEQSERVGGLWVYQESVESDPLGQRPRERIHGSLYASLRANLPRDLMAFEDYTFDSAGGGHDDWPRYPGHAQVLEYLERFSVDAGIRPRIRFGCRVESICPDAHGWRVDGEAFDAVAICNGHFSEPLVPDLPGLEDFRGEALHSHNYRGPEPFSGQRVLVLGASVSGAELARELATVADVVYFSGRTFRDPRSVGSRHDRITRCPPVARFLADAVVLTDGQRIEGVDAILFCTGYDYRFPFLAPGVVHVRNNPCARSVSATAGHRPPHPRIHRPAVSHRAVSAVPTTGPVGSPTSSRAGSLCPRARNSVGNMPGRYGRCGTRVWPSGTSTAWTGTSSTTWMVLPGNAATRRFPPGTGTMAPTSRQRGCPPRRIP